MNEAELRADTLTEAAEAIEAEADRCVGRQHDQYLAGLYGAADLLRTLAAGEPEPPALTRVRVDNREPECVEAWPGCHFDGYDPRCCRFPKACMVEGRVEWVTEPADTGPADA